MSRLHRVIVTTAVNREPPQTILDREYLVVPPLLSVLAAAESDRSTFPARGLQYGDEVHVAVKLLVGAP